MIESLLPYLVGALGMFLAHRFFPGLAGPMPAGPASTLDALLDKVLTHQLAPPAAGGLTEDVKLTLLRDLLQGGVQKK